MAINRLNPDYPDAGIVQLMPSSVAVGSGSSTVNGNGQVSFSGSSSVSFNGVFSSTYDNYKIIFRPTSIASDGIVYMKLRKAGTDNSATYNWNGIFMSNATVNGDSNTSTNGWSLTNMDAGQTAYNNSSSIELFGPFIAFNTGILYSARGYTDVGAARFGTWGGQHESNDSYDGFSFIFTGNVSGTISVYGFRN